MRGITEIERAVFVVVVALFPHLKKETFVKRGLSKTSSSNVAVVCKAAIATQERKTFVYSEWFFSQLHNIFVIISSSNNDKMFKIYTL